MLQKIRAHTQGWLAWLLILALAFVFALWGIGGYLTADPKEQVIAEVDGESITLSDLQIVYERLAQQSQMAQMMAGIQVPVINEDIIRNQALESLIMERLLTKTAETQGFWVTRDQVNSILLALPQFQVNGEFSPELYERVIRQMNFTPESFKDTVQKELLITQAESTIRDSVFLLPYQVDTTVDLVNQSRDIQYAVFGADTFADEIKLTEEDLRAYYDSHQSEFMTEETLKVAYIELDRNKLAEKIKANQKPSDAQLQEYYDVHIARFTTPEKRSAKHILLAASPNAPDSKRKEAKTKADDIISKLKAGESFADLAQTYSDDPGTANMGGELGYFGRGEMVPEFEEAVFTHDVGETVGPVKTDFGYHIIYIDDIQTKTVQGFEDVKETLFDEWYDDKIAEQYDYELNEIDQMSFEQADNLEGVSDAFDLPIKTMTLTGDVDSNPELGKNRAVMQAAFGEEVLYGRQNSEILRVSPEKAVVLRVTEHATPEMKAFESVKTELQTLMHKRQGLFLARQKANAIIEGYNKGESLADLAVAQKFKWESQKDVSRQNFELPYEVVQAAFSIPQKDKPALTAVEILPDQVAVVAVNKIHAGEIDPNFEETMKAEFYEGLTQFKGTRDYNFYLAASREKMKIDVKD